MALGCDQCGWHLCYRHPEDQHNFFSPFFNIFLALVHTWLWIVAILCRCSKLSIFHTNEITVKFFFSLTLWLPLPDHHRATNVLEGWQMCQGNRVNIPTGSFNKKQNKKGLPALDWKTMLYHSTSHSAVNKARLWHNQAIADGHKAFVLGTPETPWALSSIPTALLENKQIDGIEVWLSLSIYIKLQSCEMAIFKAKRKRSAVRACPCVKQVGVPTFCFFASLFMGSLSKHYRAFSRHYSSHLAFKSTKGDCTCW